MQVESLLLDLAGDPFVEIRRRMANAKIRQSCNEGINCVGCREPAPISHENQPSGDPWNHLSHHLCRDGQAAAV